MKADIKEIIDFSKVDTLLEGFNKSTGFVTAILDLEGHVLSKSGWRQICTDFHRVHVDTAKNCTISDTVLAGKLADGEKYHFYQCLNGLTDVAMPIMVGGEHIANLFSGQFFMEEPDKESFIQQAEKYGFDKEKYLDALGKVPVVSAEKVETAMDFLSDLTQFIAEQALQKKELNDLNQLLHASESKFRTISDKFSDLILLIDVNNIVKYASPASEKMFGLLPKQLRDRSFTAFIQQESMPKALEMLNERNADQNRESGWELLMKKHDGSVFLGEVKIAPHSEGTFEGSIILVSDISHRKLIEHTSIRLAKEWQAIFDSLEDAVWLLDPDFRITNCNRAAEIVFRTPAEEMIGKYCWEVAHDTHGPIYDCPAVRLRKSLHREQTDLQLGEKFFQVTVDPIMNEEGSLTGAVHVVSDITERKKAESALENAYQILSSFMKHSPIYTYLKEVSAYESRVMWASDNFQDMIGISGSEMIGKKNEDLFPLEFAKKLTQDDWRIVSEDKAVQYEEQLYQRNYQTIKFPITIGENKYLAGYTIDITEQKLAETLLRVSEEKYRTLISSMINAFGLHEMIYDESGEPIDFRFLELNPEWEKTVGLKVKDVLGKTAKEVIPTIEDKWIQLYGRVVKTGIPEEFEDFNAYTGKYFHVFVYRPLEGKFAVVFNDISDPKRAEEALRVSERRFDLAMLVKNEGIWDWNLISGDVYFDARYYLMAGYEVNEFPHKLEEFTKRVHPDDVDAVMRDAEKHLKGLLDSFRVEFRFRKKNEDYIWIFACGNIVERDENGRPTRFIGTHQDVTEFKRIRLLDESRLHLLHYSENHTLEELLEETLNVTEKITESKIGFYHFVEDDQVTIHLKNWSTNTKATYCKADAAEMKYKLKDAGVWTDCIKQRKTVIHNDYLSLPHRKGLPVGHAEVLREMVVPVIKGEKITAILGVGNKATNYNLQDALTIEKLAELAWDIAERKKLNLALAESQSYLKELNAQKDKFFSIIAHDLRSPFNAILGLSQHLLDLIEEKDYEDIEKIGRVLFQSSERAMNLLMNLLEWSRTQTGRIELNPEPFSIKDLVEEIVPVFEDIAQKKSVGIESSVNEFLSIYADKHMIGTVIRNLINNAVKYTGRNGIVKISAKHHQAGVTVSVKDNGVGIPIERLDKLFRIDTSESTPGTANEKGTGLGLILCKEFVERNGGIIWAESIVGSGSVFYFTIPDIVKQAESSESKQSDVITIIEEKRKLKILVVDDDDVSEVLLHESIKKISREILQAETGHEAVAIAQNNPDIDLILMDLRMPQMGGYEATQQIRQFNKDVIIIAQTAYVLLNDREKAIEAGCNDYIEKPISKEKLLEMIHRYFVMKTSPPIS